MVSADSGNLGFGRSLANADAVAAAFEENFLDALATLCLVAKEAAA